MARLFNLHHYKDLTADKSISHTYPSRSTHDSNTSDSYFHKNTTFIRAC